MREPNRDCIECHGLGCTYDPGTGHRDRCTTCYPAQVPETSRAHQHVRDYTRELLASEKPAVTYLLYFPNMRAVAREHGYALAIHGSLNRDFDLVAVPWTPEASDAETLVQAICDTNALVIAVRDQQDKPHGRRCWTLKGISGCPHGWVDLSVMPRLTTPSVEDSCAR